MKINGNLEGVFKAYKTTKVEKKDNEDLKNDNSSKVSVIKDKVTISNEIKVDNRTFEINFMKKRIGDIAEVRADKVADIKEQVKNGSYKIDLDKVAESIINRIV